MIVAYATQAGQIALGLTSDSQSIATSTCPFLIANASTRPATRKSFDAANSVIAQRRKYKRASPHGTNKPEQNSEHNSQAGRRCHSENLSDNRRVCCPTAELHDREGPLWVLVELNADICRSTPARGLAKPLDHGAGAIALATASKSIQFTPQRWPSGSSKLRPYMKSKSS
jgi:hypothetical protein